MRNFRFLTPGDNVTSPWWIDRWNYLFDSLELSARITRTEDRTIISLVKSSFEHCSLRTKLRPTILYLIPRVWRIWRSLEILSLSREKENISLINKNLNMPVNWRIAVIYSPVIWIRNFFHFVFQNFQRLSLQLNCFYEAESSLI